MRIALLVAVALYLAPTVVRAQPYDPNAAEPDKPRPKASPAPKKSSGKAGAAASQPASQPSRAGSGAARAPASTDADRRAAGDAAARSAAARKLDPYDPRLDSTGTPPLPPRENRLPPPSAKRDQARPQPNYRGRPAKGTTAGDVLIWIPRVVFFPAHVVLEYVVRRPIVWTMTRMEEHNVFARIQRFFSFRDGKTSIYPTAFIDFGLNPTVGFLNLNNDVFFKGHSLTFQGGFWAGWINLQATSSFPVFRNDTGQLTLRGQFYTRPDQVFTGVGPGTRFEDETFYRNRTGEVELRLRGVLKDLSRVNLGVLYRDTSLSDGFGPSIETLFDTNNDQVVPGFGHYRLLQIAAKLELDSRSPDVVFTPGSGVRLEAWGAFNFDPSQLDRNFFRWGGELAGFWDVSGINHVLALRVYVDFIEKTGELSVPVSELIALGGPEYMRGFLLGRLRGQSAFVMTASYQYPIWTFLDANLFIGVGNTFNGRYEDFHFKRMYLNFGFGLRSNFTRDAAIELAFAFGSNRFDSDDYKLETFRFVFGVNQGF